MLATGVTPVLLRVATQPDSLFDTLFVTTSDNKFYYLEGGHRYPSWSLVSNPTSFSIVDLQATYDKSSVLRVSVVLFQNGSHIAYDVNLTNGQWFTDRAVQTATVSVSDYVFSADFGSSTNNTQFGYLIATGNGLTAVTSGMRNNPSVVATVRPVITEATVVSDVLAAQHCQRRTVRQPVDGVFTLHQRNAALVCDWLADADSCVLSREQ